MLSEKNLSIAVLSKAFKNQNYVVIDNFLSPEECKKLLYYLYKCEEKELMINVNHSSLIGKQKFKTINGVELEDNIPIINEINVVMNKIINLINKPLLFPLKNKMIGQSVNLTPSGGVFSWHYDRNLVTALIYLNEVEGGELEVYPGYRIRIDNNHFGIRKFIQRVFDFLIRPSLIRYFIGKKKAFHPVVGRAIIINSTCLHQVKPVRGNQERAVIALGYDYLNKDFSEEKTKNYYGYRNKKIQIYS